MDQPTAFELCERLARHFVREFSIVFNSALADIGKHYEHTWYLYNSTEKAALMHAHVRAHVKRVFGPLKGVYIIEERGWAFRMVIDGESYGVPHQSLFKFKKTNPKLLTSNIPTRAVERFNSQRSEIPGIIVQVQLGLFGEDRAILLEEPAHMNAGYIPNATWTGFDRLCVTYPLGMRTSRLAVEVPLSASHSVADIHTLPSVDVTAAPAPRKRVRPRKTKPTAVPDAPKKRIKGSSDGAELPDQDDGKKKASGDEPIN